MTLWCRQAMKSLVLGVGIAAGAVASETGANPFEWLEHKSDPKVQAWVKQQDQTARRHLAAIPGRAELRKRLEALSRIEDISVPKRIGDRFFYTRQGPLENKPRLLCRDGDQDERVLLDLNRRSGFSLGDWKPSPDGRKVAYLLKRDNRDEATLHVLDVASLQESPQDVIEGATFADVSWNPDSRSFYYVRLPMDKVISDEKRVGEADIRLHLLGVASNADGMIYPPTHNPQIYLSPQISRDGHWLIVTEWNGWGSNRVVARDVSVATSTFVSLFVSTSTTATVEMDDASFFRLSYAGHLNGEISRSVRSASPVWTVVVPERPTVSIQEMRRVGDGLVLLGTSQAEHFLEWYRLDGTLVGRMQLPVAGAVDDLEAQPRERCLYFSYQSISVAPQIYEACDFAVVPKRWAGSAETLPSFPSDRVSYRSKDGTTVTMLVVGGKGKPMLLHGYGGFSEVQLPRFNPMSYVWLEKGGSLALPHVRGGGEYGEAWHQAGMGIRKQNTFDDAIAAAEFLIKENYVSPQQLGIQGTSNGGLLVGAVVTQRPDLFRAAFAKAALLDMVRYPLFGQGPAWISEYGDPSRADDLKALLAYSPYHHVHTGVAYPAMLFWSWNEDDRVDPMHARKMTAALQAAGSKTVLLRTSTGGHSGSGERSSQLDEWVDRLSFFSKELGWNQKRAASKPFRRGATGN